MLSISGIWSKGEKTEEIMRSASSTETYSRDSTEEILRCEEEEAWQTHVPSDFMNFSGKAVPSVRLEANPRTSHLSRVRMEASTVPWSSGDFSAAWHPSEFCCAQIVFRSIN